MCNKVEHKLYPSPFGWDTIYFDRTSNRYYEIIDSFSPIQVYINRL